MGFWGFETKLCSLFQVQFISREKAYIYVVSLDAILVNGQLFDAGTYRLPQNDKQYKNTDLKSTDFLWLIVSPKQLDEKEIPIFKDNTIDAIKSTQQMQDKLGKDVFISCFKFVQ